MELLDKEEKLKHIGPDLEYDPKIYDLQPIIDYFVEKCNKVGIEHSHDCTADEMTHWKTMNYTTYAGLFIMHPLCYSAQTFQMYDALTDKATNEGHIDWIRDNIRLGLGSKYQLKKPNKYKDYKAIAILMGHNKYAQHVSKVKMSRLVHKFGSDLLIKPHPISNEKMIEEINNIKGDAQVADKDEDLYTLMDKAEYVYTTHISETALTGLIMGKKVSPIDPFKMRLRGSFSHINHFCFSYDNPLDVVGTIMASPKSGIVHPEVDIDWKGKIDAYFDYSLRQRQLQQGHYLGY